MQHRECTISKFFVCLCFVFLKLKAIGAWKSIKDDECNIGNAQSWRYLFLSKILLKSNIDLGNY